MDQTITAAPTKQTSELRPLRETIAGLLHHNWEPKAEQILVDVLKSLNAVIPFRAPGEQLQG